MVKVNKKSSSAVEVVGGIPPLRSAEKVTSLEKKKKEKKQKIEKEKKVEAVAKKLSISAEKSDNIPEKELKIHIYERAAKVKILPADSRTLFAINLNPHRRSELVKARFEKFFRKVGKVLNVSIHNLNDDKFKPCAKIEFESHDVAKKALKHLDGDLLLGRFVKFEVSLESIGSEYITYVDDNRNLVYVRGFGQSIDVIELQINLRKYFSSIGEVIGIKAPKLSRNHLSKGFAFIQFEDGEGFSKALEQDGNLFMGVPLQVRKAKVIVTNI